LNWHGKQIAIALLAKIPEERQTDEIKGLKAFEASKGWFWNWKKRFGLVRNCKCIYMRRQH